MVNRRDFIKSTAATFLSLYTVTKTRGAQNLPSKSGYQNNSSKSKPNIIFLLTDDQRYNAMGCYGNKYIITPNLDKLAKEGMLFENVYHAAPICQPSRASIMTGRFLTSHRCGFDRPTNFAISEAEFEKSYPVVLRKAGYRTAFVGKFGFPVAEDKVLNVEFPYPNGKRDHLTQLWKKAENMPSNEFDEWYGFAGQGRYRTSKGHLTEVNADNACKFIAESKKSHPDKPFCLSVSFKAPHSPNQPMKKYLELYDKIDIPRHENDSVEYFKNLPEVVRKQYRGRKGIGNFSDFIKKYYALVTGVDAAVGKIREELKKHGLEKKTVIIYSSDNGYFCGSKRLKGKDLLYEESVKAPLIYYDPRMSKAKQQKKVKGLASTIDFAPTMLDLAGVEKPGSMQGFSLLPLVTGSKTEVRESTFSENNFSSFGTAVSDAANEAEKETILEKGTVRSKCVRTKRYKYIRYQETKPMVEEFWDIKADPLEEHNLVNSPQHKDTLKEMRQKCDDYVKMAQQGQT